MFSLPSSLPSVLLLLLLSFSFSPSVHAATDYSNLEYWGCLPIVDDMCDQSYLPNNQNTRDVDVLYFHPTTYNGSETNQPIEEAIISESTPLVLKSQASVFVGGARVFAPFYEQANLGSFENSEYGPAALDHAYEDGNAAFLYYLKTWNEDRHFILAGHSQGAFIVVQLLKQYFIQSTSLGEKLRKMLIAAYIIGELVADDTFDNQIPVCKSPHQQACYVSYSTANYGAPMKAACGSPLSNCASFTLNTNSEAACVNPLTMTTTENVIPKTKNPGSLTLNEEIVPNLLGGQCLDGILRINDTDFTDDEYFFNQDGDYHASDYELWYAALYQNIIDRSQSDDASTLYFSLWSVITCSLLSLILNI